MASISLFPPSALSYLRHLWEVEDGKFLQEGEGKCKDRGNEVQTKGRTSQTFGQNRWLEGIREPGREAGMEWKSIGNIGRLEFEFVFPLCMIMKSHRLSESQFFILYHPLVAFK